MPLASKNLSQIVTLSRASARMNTNSAGVLTTLASGIFGIDYDPSTLTVRGMPVEEQRTNLLLWNQQFDNAAWIKTRSTVSANALTAPDGTLTADKFVEDSTATSSHQAVQTLLLADNTVYTHVVYAKKGERDNIFVGMTDKVGGTVYGRVFDLTLGTTAAPITATFSSATSFSIEAAGNGWYRCSISQSSASGASTPSARLYGALAGGSTSYTGDGTSGVYIWGAQFEAGSFASSYMGETTTAAITRLTDSLTIGTLSPWYNATEGTFYVEAIIPSVGGGGFGAMVALDDGTANNAMEWSLWDAASDAIKEAIWVGGVSQASITAGTYTAGTTLKLAGVYKANDFAASANGAAIVTDGAGSVPTVTRLLIGLNRGGSNALNGWVRKIIYYPSRKTNAELVTMSA